MASEKRHSFCYSEPDQNSSWNFVMSLETSGVASTYASFTMPTLRTDTETSSDATGGRSSRYADGCNKVFIFRYVVSYIEL
jgi:hypothetical protein